MRASVPARAGLRLLPGGVEDPLNGAGWDAPAPLARPADRCEPWPLDPRRATGFLQGARAAGLAVELAAVIAVERLLLEEDLHQLGLGKASTVLDALAGQARVRRELSEPASAYLASLECDRRASSRTPAMLALPARLRERIGAREAAELLDARMLASAIAWERAAVLSGRTMSEWALFTLAAGGG